MHNADEKALMRTKSVHYPARAALERKKNSDFCVLEAPKRGVFNGKLDYKSGAAEFFFCGRREQKVVLPPCLGGRVRAV